MFDLTVEKPGHLEMVVHSSIGRVIRSLFSGDVTPGAVSFDWDGNDDRGNPAASGMYLMSVKLNGSDLTRTMVLVR